MLEPQNAISNFFNDFTVLYDVDTFAIAYDNTDKIIIMRWNGESEEHNGYPIGKGNKPLWFRVGKKLVKPILTMLLAQEKSKTKEILEILKNI